jgi:solute:Na+ symporter, SSS family
MNLSLSAWYWAIGGGGALVVNILLGLWLALRARRSERSDEFFLAGRRLMWPIVGASLLATNIGAEHMVGLCGDAYLQRTAQPPAA